MWKNNINKKKAGIIKPIKLDKNVSNKNLAEFLNCFWQINKKTSY